MQLKEEAIFTLKFDGKPVINELGELEKRLIDVKEAQKTVEKGTKEWADNKEDIKKLEAAIKGVRDEMGVSGMTVKQLEGYYRQLNREIKDLTPGTEAYKAKASDLKSVNDALANHRQTIRGVSDEIEKQPSLWERAKAGVLVFFAAFGAMELIQRAFSFVQDGIKSALELSDTMGKVAKATGQTTEQVQALANELDKVDTRTTKEGLMEIAQIGGQLGVANNELVGFVKAVDMATVALGDEFTGGAEEASNKLGGLQKLFKETQELKAGEAITKIGSALNDLGAAGTATGPVVAEFTARMGQLGDLSPQITQTMGLGAAFQELGLSAEISAGGLTNILLGAAKATGLFADQLGMSEKEFKKLINTNPNEFLLKLAESLRGLPADQVAKQLDNLGIKSQEATKVMSLLKDQTGMVREKQDLANKSFAEGTSLQKEFNVMNTTAAAIYEKTKKDLALLATEIGQGLLPSLVKGTQGVIAFVNIIRAIPEFVSENKTAFAALGIAILAFNGHLVVATASSIAHAAVEKARQIWTGSATAAQWLLNTAMTANPIALVITAVALLVAGFATLYNHSTTVRAGISGLFSALKVAASQLVLFWDAITSLNFAQAAKIMSEGGAKIAAGFNQGYEAEVKKGQPKQLADHTTHVGKLTKISGDGGKDAADANVLAHGGGLSKQEVAAQKHRQAELKKASDAAKKESDEQVKANNDGLKLIETDRIEAIKDDLQREIAKIRAKRDAEAEAMMASKASIEVKAEWEKALNAKMVRDIAKVEEDARKKKETEEEAARKKKATEEEKARQEFDKRERATSNEVAEAAYNAHHQSLERQLNDTRTNASQKKQIATELANAERQETLRKIQDQYTAEVNRLNNEKADAIRTAQEKGQNVDGIETQFRQRLQAAELARRTSETSAEQKFQDEKRDIEEKALVKRKENQKEWFTAIKSLMDGDFKGFTDILTKKLAGETKQLSESQKKQISTIDTVGEYTVMAVQALSKLNQMAMEKQISNINKEKNTQLNAWKEKYDKGLIGKDEYEKGLDKINKDADQKIKAAQLEGFKRQQKIDIALAVINGAQAALKSLAMLGWPLGLIAVAGAAVTTAIQIGMIKRQQPPSLASGGTIRNGGVPDGPRHGTQYGQSGISLVRRDTGEEVGEMEGQEPIMVLSRLTYANNKRVVDSLLHSSLHRNGAPIYRAGGVFGSDGGSYGDYLARGRSRSGVPAGAGLRRYDQGGWMEQVNDDYSSSRDSGGGYQSSYNGGGGDGETQASTSSSDAAMQAQIDASQKTQEAIAKAGELTAKNTMDIVDLIRAQGYQLDYIRTAIASEASTTRSRMDYGFGGLRQDVAERLDRLREGSGVQNLALQYIISTGFANLQNTFKLEVPGLGKELTQELNTLRTSLNLNLFLMRLGLSQDLTSLEKTTQTGFDILTKTAHTDLTDLAKLIDLDLTALTLNVHDDLAALDLNVDTNLTELQRAVHLDLDSLKLAQAVQAALLRSDTKVNFTTLQTILKTELEALRADTHTDLGNVANSNTTELKAVQGILAATKNEQGYQSDLLGRIASKDLSVSVQTFVNVFNQIDVIADKSNFK